ncbi:sulfite exporter TauE/SafE family protein [Paracoccus pacificus]|uniref:Probable membrane transporter protein n=1 Tax=Paracoccus pacificus TaxID=1463598 RepID=A0ABW4RB82_9RHOB
METIALLFGAGFVAGVMNTVAGGGTFVTFPTLVFTGIPIVAANATSTLAALPGYLAGALGFRRELASIDRAQVLRLTVLTVIGSIIGSVLLIFSSNKAFSAIVPFLLLIATLAFVFGEQIRAFASRHAREVTAFGAGGMLGVSIYGGYFNGGLGIILLSLFSLWGMRDLHQMNGLKTWLSFALSLISVAVFLVYDMFTGTAPLIHWNAALIMALGTITGGYLGAPLARRIPRPILRALIAAIGFGMAAVFFWRMF